MSKFEELLEALGEGFHGEELDTQKSLADPGDSGTITRARFDTWYASFLADDGAESDDDAEEMEEERQNAVRAFDSVDSAASGLIATDQFASLFEALGSTYCEEEHAKFIPRLSTDGQILKGDFVAWYVDWVFGNDDGDDEACDDASGPKTLH